MVTFNNRHIAIIGSLFIDPTRNTRTNQTLTSELSYKPNNYLNEHRLQLKWF